MPQGETTGRSVALDVGTGVGTMLWYALHDVVGSRVARGAIKSVLFVGGAAAYAALSDDGPDAVAAPDPAPAGALGAGLPAFGVPGFGVTVPDVDPDVGGVPWRRLGIVAVATSAASRAGTVRVDRGMARAAAGLRRRGVRRPYTAMGAVIGVATALSRPSLQVAR